MMLKMQHCITGINYIKNNVLVDEEIPPLLYKVLWVPRKVLYNCNELLLIIIIIIQIENSYFKLQ